MTDQPIDLEALLAPLDSGEQGAGQDLRDDYSPASSYQQLRDARAAARDEERARDSEGETDAPTAEGWREMLRIGQRALATQSKDFEIAAWLTEALVRIHGLRGLAGGAALINGLCGQYWESGFPRADDEGMQARAIPVGGLSGTASDGTVMQPLRRLALFRRVDGTGLSLYQWDQAEATAALAEDRRAARYAAGVPELEVLQAEARADAAYLSDIASQANAAMQAWQAMTQSVTERFGPEAPSLRRVAAILQRIGEVANAIVGPIQAAEELRQAEQNATAGGSDEPAPSAIGANGQDPVASGGSDRLAPAARSSGRGGPLTSREDALRELERIAQYFRHAEPHSPLAYTLEEAVRRGRMTLAELLREVLPDEGARMGMLSSLGMRTSVDPDESNS